MSVAPYISGTIHYMILIYGTRVEEDNISRSFLYFFQILIRMVNSRVKGQKMAENDRMSVSLHNSGSIHHMIAIIGTNV